MQYALTNTHMLYAHTNAQKQPHMHRHIYMYICITTNILYIITLLLYIYVSCVREKEKDHWNPWKEDLLFNVSSVTAHNSKSAFVNYSHHV